MGSRGPCFAARRSEGGTWAWGYFGYYVFSYGAGCQGGTDSCWCTVPTRTCHCVSSDDTRWWGHPMYFVFTLGQCRVPSQQWK